MCVRCPKYKIYKWLNASNGTTRYTYFWFFYMKHIPGTRYTATTQEATEQQVVAVGPRPQDIYSKQQSRFRLVSSPVLRSTHAQDSFAIITDVGTTCTAVVCLVRDAIVRCV